ncbi:hypothetical protein LAZ67_19001189 [Cordylochernes scorpioides]|uniref:HTH CENPB-type domain-containing protein n=1 Tax=Cordylochernes scorpioides TaxID=51811 RepID=A0ABY6LM88_9ARAC|nr:hypothetical protein LAZ67_19001189 [Cordylochernes scorpioides]
MYNSDNLAAFAFIMSPPMLVSKKSYTAQAHLHSPFFSVNPYYVGKVVEFGKFNLFNYQMGGRRRSRDIIRVDSIDNEGHFGSEKTQRRVLVPKDLTFDQKNARKETARVNLEATTDDPELLKRVITGDETWIYGFDSETTQQASEWRFKNEPRPKKARKAPSKVKVMLTVLFDYQGIVHHEFQQQGSTIIADSYLGVLSPYLAPCDFFLFGKPKKKKKLKGRKFQSIEEIKVESKKAMKAIPKADYQSSTLKRDCDGEFPEIEEALFRWIRQANAMKLAINGNILKEKAILLALKMGQDNFEASNGWLEKFKARRNIAFKRLHGEAGSVDANSVATWKGISKKKHQAIIMIIIINMIT